MKIFKTLAVKLWKDESGQGTAEYALIVVAIVAISLMFGRQIKDRLMEFINGNVKGALNGFTEGRFGEP